MPQHVTQLPAITLPSQGGPATPQVQGGQQAAPPKSPEELQQRVGLWKQFLEKLRTDPALQDSLMRFGTTLMQPIQPGQSEAGQLGTALQSGANALRQGQARTAATEAAGRKEARDVERLDLERRRTTAGAEQGAEQVDINQQRADTEQFRAVTDRNRKARGGGGATAAAVQNRSDYALALLVNDSALPEAERQYTQPTAAQRLAAAKLDAARFLKEEDLLTIAGRILAAKQAAAAVGLSEGVDIVAESIADAKALKRGINTGGLAGDTDFVIDEEGNLVPK